MAICYLSLGSNTGDRTTILEQAMTMLHDSGVLIVTRSAIYETAPWGFDSNHDFMNMVVHASTIHSCEKLQEINTDIELRLGRARDNTSRYSSRTIDIDILLYDQKKLVSPALTIPHPRMSERRFVLEPLVEIAPDLLHPTIGETIASLLKKCNDQLKVRKITSQETTPQ